jgi:hypothetical protein
MIFNQNAELQERYPDAHKAWRETAREHSMRAAAKSEENAPSARQAANLVPKSSWDQALKGRLAEADPHASLTASQAAVLIAYLAFIPPKRAGMGCVNVFASDPTPEQVAQHPNSLTLDSGTLRTRPRNTMELWVSAEFMSILRA